jgi:general secretion pathway protein B
MSYILDALKRADAQRQQGAAPGLHLLQEPVPLGKLPAEPAKKRLALPIALGAALLAFGAGAAYWATHRTAPVQVAGVSIPQPAASQTVITPHTVRPVAPPPAAPVPPKPQAKVAPKTDAASAPSPVLKPVAVPAMDSAKAAPTKAVAKASEPAIITETVSAPVAALAPAATAAANTAVNAAVNAANNSANNTAVSAAPAPVHEVPKLSELPDALQRKVPKLSVTGSVYSDNPAQRLLVVNGQVLTQGSHMGPELRLEEIGVKSSVFSYAGTRFKVSN